jgi:hypothetical protein
MGLAKRHREIAYIQKNSKLTNLCAGDGTPRSSAITFDRIHLCAYRLG